MEDQPNLYRSPQMVALSSINDQFKVAESVQELQHCMREVTKQGMSAETVNAACNCVQNINNTIKTAIMAARYLAEK